MVMEDLNCAAWMVFMNIASSAPPTPAKKQEMQKAICLCLKSLTPMASAAISSSRMALNAAVGRV